MQDFFDWFIYNTKLIMPKWLFNIFAPIYHFILAIVGALIYQFPSKSLFVIAVTGTKGKTSTVEFINAILEEQDFSTAIASTLRFKVGEKTRPNLFKMTMPGRYFLQKFMREAVNAGCSHIVIEMTSEGVKQYRHKFIALNALVFTNLSPEHIESHGSYEKYVLAKLSIAKLLADSQKNKKTLVVNGDDKEADRFLDVCKNIKNKITYTLEEAEPYKVYERYSTFTFKQEKIIVHLVGIFNIYNALAAASLSSALNISVDTTKRGIEKLTRVRGRMEYVTDKNADFDVVVDYAHTTDSLRQAYEALPNKPKICVFGATGGGRDKWKRPKMGKVSARYCKHIILTDDDPYDEDSLKIINDIKIGIDEEVNNNLQIKPKVEIEVDRRKAIEKAIACAKKGDIVILTGKGTDPYLMKKNGEKVPWNDANFAKIAINKVIPSK